MLSDFEEAVVILEIGDCIDDTDARASTLKWDRMNGYIVCQAFSRVFSIDHGPVGLLFYRAGAKRVAGSEVDELYYICILQSNSPGE